ncbi:MAG: hypothetical protein NVSMB70_15950 [Chamaesiphon sp.]
MTDHLEPYRRMVRSIRFVPPLARNQQEAQLVKPAPGFNTLFRNIVSATTATPSLGSDPDPCEHIAALVRTAVSKQTVFPIIYVIPENIGDRISRLAPPKVVTPVIIPPKIPQPDPNWKPAYTVAIQHPESNGQELFEDADINVPTLVEVASEPPQQNEATIELKNALVELPPSSEQVLNEEFADRVAPSPIAIEETPVGVSPDKAEDSQQLNSLTEVAPPEKQVPEAFENMTLDQKELVIPVNSPSLDASNTSDTEKEIQIQCPTCESTNLSKNGHRKDKQRYICKNCGNQFLESDVLCPKTDKLKTNINSSIKTSDVNEPQSLIGISDSNSKSSVDQTQNKKKAKGFGTHKTKK